MSLATRLNFDLPLLEMLSEGVAVPDRQAQVILAQLLNPHSLIC